MSFSDNLITDLFDCITQLSKIVKPTSSSLSNEYFDLLNRIDHLSNDISEDISNNSSSNRVASLVDRLPLLIEQLSIVRSIPKFSGVLALLSAMVAHTTEDIYNSIVKLIPKIINSCCKSSMKENNNLFGLSALYLLATSKLRMILIPFAKNIRFSCCQLLSRSVNKFCTIDFDSELLMNTIALYISLESTDIWLSYWLQMIQEMVHILSLIGINSPLFSYAINASSNVSRNTLGFTYDESLSELSGDVKVNLVKTMYNQLSTITAKMLEFGCSSGTLQLDLSNVIPLYTMILNLKADLSANEPLNNIPNDCNVSQADISSIAISLK
eukprot:gene14059-18860_t